MSATIGLSFEGTCRMAHALTYAIEQSFFTGDALVEAKADLDYIREKMWTIYPYLCEAYFDQTADDRAAFSVTLLPAETIAANLAAME